MPLAACVSFLSQFAVQTHQFGGRFTMLTLAVDPGLSGAADISAALRVSLALVREVLASKELTP